MIIAGTYLDGISSKRIAAQLQAMHDSPLILRICHEDKAVERVHLQFDELSIESRLADTPREINLGDERLFVTDDNDSIDELIEQNEGSNFQTGLLYRLEKNLGLIVLATLVTVVVIYSAITFGIPKSAEYIAYKLPDFTHKHFGSSLAILDKTLLDPSKLDEARQQHIQDLVAPYLDEYQHLNPKLVFRSGMKANALALPDGHMVFTDDFVNLIRDDDELLAVLFHEIGHLEYKHMLRRVLQDSMVTLLIILVTGDIDTIDLITGLPTLLLDLSYSKDFEREADQFALEQLHKANIDVDAFGRAMTNLESYYVDEAEGQLQSEKSAYGKTLSDFLSTHPATEDRVEMVEIFKKLHKAEN